ncbi:NAD(P)-dependent oxidoreductase [Arthrobacter sp. PGP41]|uniref:NAD-dependent epimerase/dehydratase family protein n=1 Tax=unclassified Arthrobacter TaxID=235627 RepID=UPI000CDCB69C|nr:MULTISPECIES: NAD-dependent epimerase/dehydratase family protein [unclassified Arthrobacter]AUZ35710.1 NAD(P)-dependent oxidoreductase [Arthrobacter sp. PGP41]MDT0193777.1 NAD-dependent epimerase/dehydratase family protein [Arthrobacter sp. AB6]
MKVLITGGAGFIGQHLAQSLVGAGHDVTALDILDSQVHQDPQDSAERFPGEVFLGDVADVGAWMSLPPHDAVVHLAAETGTAQSMYETEHYRRVNVEGTRMAAEAAVRWGAKIVLLSSRAVYGEGRVLSPGESLPAGVDGGADGTLVPSSEEDRHRPVSVYGETKSRAEHVLMETVAAKVPATIIRPQNVIGRGQALHNPYTGVLAAFLARLKDGLPLTLYGDGTQTRDFVHVEDVVALIEWSLENTEGALETPRVLNSGTGVRTTLKELALYAMEAAPNVNVPIEYLAVRRAGDIDHACADLRRLRALGAPLPRWQTKEAIADFIRSSWHERGAAPEAWDEALDELKARGLTE